MKGGIGQLMKQAQQMQADMQKAQEEMDTLNMGLKALREKVGLSE